ncbi:hypothetical protein [Flagellimonas aurea]|uniref:hypothetical protein n=1 Tax=Flagellimonas aurea TaxID=2915619 RepID=UPI001F25E222|nr:hypothetical protein [Allomuricauda aurea]
MKHKVFTELQMDFIEETKCEYATAYNYIIEPIQQKSVFLGRKNVLTKGAAK